jgi:hypothetical protein
VHQYENRGNHESCKFGLKCGSQCIICNKINCYSYIFINNIVLLYFGDESFDFPYVGAAFQI